MSEEAKSLEGDAQGEHTRVSVRDIWSAYAPLVPTVLGLVCARCSMIIGSYGSYTSTDDGLYTDGSFLMAAVVLAVLVYLLARKKDVLSKRTVNIVFRVSVVCQVATLAVLGLFELQVLPRAPLWLMLSIHALNQLLGVECIAYWFRRMRGCSTTTAVIVLFNALIVSEVVLLVFAYLPLVANVILVAVLTACQLPFVVMARARALASELETPTLQDDYFSFMEDFISSARFLVISGLGIALFSIVLGFLRGYPGGEPIAFTPVTRLGYFAATVIVCLVVIFCILHGRTRIITVGMWVIMQAFACAAMIFYALLPDALEWGGMFATSSNALMVVFDWYLIVAFMSYGFRDPNYYAFSGIAVFLVPRAIARTLESALFAATASTTLVMAIMGVATVISAQFILAQLQHISKYENGRDAACEEQASAEHEEERRHSVLVHDVMGLDEPLSREDVLRQTMEQRVREMGEQFMLTDREVDVLTLYALGLTQQRVAEQLYISPGTVHTHIKRIYAKTNLHSRQGIIDYLKRYTD